MNWIFSFSLHDQIIEYCCINLKLFTLSFGPYRISWILLISFDFAFEPHFGGHRNIHSKITHAQVFFLLQIVIECLLLVALHRMLRLHNYVLCMKSIRACFRHFHSHTHIQTCRDRWLNIINVRKNTSPHSNFGNSSSMHVKNRFRLLSKAFFCWKLEKRIIQANNRSLPNEWCSPTEDRRRRKTRKHF